MGRDLKRLNLRLAYRAIQPSYGYENFGWALEELKKYREALEEIKEKCEVTGRAYPIARKALGEE